MLVVGGPKGAEHNVEWVHGVRLRGDKLELLMGNPPEIAAHWKASDPDPK